MLVANAISSPKSTPDVGRLSSAQLPRGIPSFFLATEHLGAVLYACEFAAKGMGARRRVQCRDVLVGQGAGGDASIAGDRQVGTLCGLLAACSVRQAPDRLRGLRSDPRGATRKKSRYALLVRPFGNNPLDNACRQGYFTLC